MNSLKRAWQEIISGRNLDIYITALSALLITFLGMFQIVNETTILSAILATLAIISINLLKNRRSNDQLNDSILRLEQSQGAGKSVLKQNFERSVLKPLINDQSKELIFWAVNSTTTLSLLKDNIEAGLCRGLNVKLIFVEPGSAALQMHAFRNRHQDAAEVNAVLQTNLSRLVALAKRVTTGNIEIRVVNYLPPFTLIAVDPDLPTGKMFVRLLTFRVPDDSRPYMELDSKNNKEWFKFFVEQFNLVWEASTPFRIEAIQPARPDIDALKEPTVN
jgi:hypothetical protein